jgi:hypothetical protein
VKAAGPRARLDQEAPGHPLGRDQIGKLELDAHQLFTQVPGLPSGLAAALPDPIDHRAHRSPLPPEIVVSALSIDTVPQMPRPIPARSRERRRSTPTIITPDRHEHTRSAPDQPAHQRVQVGTISLTAGTERTFSTSNRRRAGTAAGE